MRAWHRIHLFSRSTRLSQHQCSSIDLQSWPFPDQLQKASLLPASRSELDTHVPICSSWIRLSVIRMS